MIDNQTFNEFIQYSIENYSAPHVIVESGILIQQWSGFEKFVNQLNNTICLNLSPRALGYLTMDSINIYTEMSFGGYRVNIVIPFNSVLAVIEKGIINQIKGSYRSQIIDTELFEKFNKAKMERANAKKVVPDDGVIRFPDNNYQRTKQYTDGVITVSDNPLRLIQGGQYHVHPMLMSETKRKVELKIVKG